MLLLSLHFSSAFSITIIYHRSIALPGHSTAYIYFLYLQHAQFIRSFYINLITEIKVPWQFYDFSRCSEFFRLFQVARHPARPKRCDNADFCLSSQFWPERYQMNHSSLRTVYRQAGSGDTAQKENPLQNSAVRAIYEAQQLISARLSLMLLCSYAQICVLQHFINSCQRCMVSTVFEANNEWWPYICQCGQMWHSGKSLFTHCGKLWHLLSHK